MKEKIISGANEAPKITTPEEKSGKDQESFLKRLMKNPKFRGLAIGLALFSGGKGLVQNADAKPDSEKAKEQVGLELNQKDLEKTTFGGLTGDLHDRFRTAEGFNWGSLIAAFGGSAGWIEKGNFESTFSIPYEYSRLFDSAKSLNEADNQKLVEYINQKIKENIADNLHFIDPTNNSREVYNYHHREDAPSKFKITNIQITGVASPEGPQEQGDTTIKSGNIDQKNIELAQKRAADIEPLLKESLRRLGLDNQLISNIDSKEAQFNDAETKKLIEIANQEKIRGGDDSEKVFNLITQYNANKFINNEALQRELNNIIGSKRKVEVKINYEGKKAHKFIVPFPTILLLLLIRKRGIGEEAGSAQRQEGELVKRNIFPQELVETLPDEISLDNDPDFNNRFVGSLVGLPPDQKDNLREQALFNDINVFKDNPETIRGGVDYIQMIDEIADIVVLF